MTVHPEAMRWRRWLLAVGFGVALLGAAGGLVLIAEPDEQEPYYDPTDGHAPLFPPQPTVEITPPDSSWYLDQ